jgi:hypothetical protein
VSWFFYAPVAQKIAYFFQKKTFLEKTNKKKLRKTETPPNKPPKQALASMLEVNTTLESLDIGHNTLAVEGCEALEEAMKRNRTLLTLRAAQTKLGDGGVAIMASLARAGSLQFLDLRRNVVGRYGLEKLLEAVRTTPTLTAVHVDPSEPGDSLRSIKNLIQDACRVNRESDPEREEMVRRRADRRGTVASRAELRGEAPDARAAAAPQPGRASPTVAEPAADAPPASQPPKSALARRVQRDDKVSRRGSISFQEKPQVMVITDKDASPKESLRLPEPVVAPAHVVDALATVNARRRAGSLAASKPPTLAETTTSPSSSSSSSSASSSSASSSSSAAATEVPAPRRELTLEQKLHRRRRAATFVDEQRAVLPPGHPLAAGARARAAAGAGARPAGSPSSSTRGGDAVSASPSASTGASSSSSSSAAAAAGASSSSSSAADSAVGSSETAAQLQANPGEALALASRTLAAPEPFARVAFVSEGSPAHDAGVRVGDGVVKVGPVNTDDPAALVMAVTALEGKPMEFVVVRSDRVKTLTVTPRKWAGSGLLGCGTVSLNSQAGRQAAGGGSGGSGGGKSAARPRSATTAVPQDDQAKQRQLQHLQEQLQRPVPQPPQEHRTRADVHAEAVATGRASDASRPAPPPPVVPLVTEQDRSTLAAADQLAVRSSLGSVREETFVPRVPTPPPEDGDGGGNDDNDDDDSDESSESSEFSSDGAAARAAVAAAGRGSVSAAYSPVAVPPVPKEAPPPVPTEAPPPVPTEAPPPVPTEAPPPVPTEAPPPVPTEAPPPVPTEAPPPVPTELPPPVPAGPNDDTSSSSEEDEPSTPIKPKVPRGPPAVPPPPDTPPPSDHAPGYTPGMEDSRLRAWNKKILQNINEEDGETGTFKKGRVLYKAVGKLKALKASREAAKSTEERTEIESEIVSFCESIEADM